MIKSVPILYLGFILTLCFGCNTPQQDLQRSLPSALSKQQGSKLNLPQKSRPTKLYVGEKKPVIIEKQRENTSGSLFEIDNQANYLFATNTPRPLDRTILVNVTNRRTEPKPQEEAKSESTAEIDELIAALPKLEPDEEEMKPITSFTMKVIEQLANGDVILETKRSTGSEKETAQIVVKGRLPYQKFIQGNSISTNDLVNIDYQETTREEFISRKSTGWEDEYTLRMSGFNEAKSKIAARLDDKRKQLASVKKKLQTKLENMGKERKQMANERAKNLKDQANKEEKLKQVNKVLDEKDAKIQAQQEIIKQKDKELETYKNPEDKPGDDQDGAGGE